MAKQNAIKTIFHKPQSLHRKKSPEIESNGKDLKQNGNIKTIKFDRFRVHKTFIETRARSSSPKKEEDQITTIQNLDDCGISQKYKKRRVQNQEVLIKIKSLHNQIAELHEKSFEQEKCIELCFEMLDLVFRFIFVMKIIH